MLNSLFNRSKVTGNFFWKQATQLFALSLIALLVITVVFQLWNADISIPYIYSTGDIFYSDMAVKTVMESGWFHYNAYIAAPHGRPLHEFFQPYGVNYLIINLLRTVTGQDWAVILNIYILLSFLFIIWSAFLLFRSLGLSVVFAGCGAILFALMPYHTLRLNGGHLFLSSYFVVPLAIWLALSFTKEVPPILASPLIWSKLLVVFLISNCGIYYALFSCCILLIAGMLGSIKYNTFRHILTSTAYVGICATVVLATMVPTLIYLFDGNSMQFIESRSASQAEIFGMKLIQLLLPIKDHRFAEFANFSLNYGRNAPLVNENSLSSLGVIGSLGFLSLMFFFFLRGPMQKISKHFETLSIFGLCFFFLGTVGGAGSVFAWTLSPVIRGYNRVSIFLACLSLAAILLIIQHIFCFTQARKKKRIAVSIFVISITVMGILDQTSPKHIPKYSSIAARYNNDKDFILSIEQRLKEGAMVFQLPHRHFPESKPVFRENYYALLRGYLHSRKLRWSYGVQPESKLDEWYTRLSKMRPYNLVRHLRKDGFSGIYIERKAFQDNGLALERALRTLLNKPMLGNANGDLAFYDLEHVEWWPVLPDIKDYILVSGFWDWEGDHPGVHIWTKGNAKLRLLLSDDISQDFGWELCFMLKSLNDRQIWISINNKESKHYRLAARKGSLIRIPISQVGRQIDIHFKTDMPAVIPAEIIPNSLDDRALSFSLDNLWLIPRRITE